MSLNITKVVGSLESSTTESYKTSGFVLSMQGGTLICEEVLLAYSPVMTLLRNRYF